MKVLCISSIIYIAQDHHLIMELTEPATINPPFSHCCTCSVVTPAFLTACTIRLYSVLGEIQLKYTLKSNFSFLHCKFWLPPENIIPKFWDAGTGVEPSVLEIDLTHQGGFNRKKYVPLQLTICLFLKLNDRGCGPHYNLYLRTFLKSQISSNNDYHGTLKHVGFLLNRQWL